MVSTCSDVPDQGEVHVREVLAVMGDASRSITSSEARGYVGKGTSGRVALRRTVEDEEVGVSLADSNGGLFRAAFMDLIIEATGREERARAMARAMRTTKGRRMRRKRNTSARRRTCV